MKPNTINVTTVQHAQQVAALCIQIGASISYSCSRNEARGHNFIFVWDTDMEKVMGHLQAMPIAFTNIYLEL